MAQQVQTSSRTVYYDGACALCSAEISVYKRSAQGAAASDIVFVDVSKSKAETGPGLDRATAMARFHVRSADGSLKSGAAAFIELWAALPRSEEHTSEL